MIFHALITAQEPRSYKRKDGQEVKEMTYTCIDWDPSTDIRLKDTVDVIISEADRVALAEKMPNGNALNQQVQFEVSEIRPGAFGPRLRFTARVPLAQFTPPAKTGK